MYINWPHHYIPKISASCSVFVNFLLIYILQNDAKLKLGQYRYLLIFFALYNLTSTAGDIFIPMCCHNYRYAFSIFILDGIFEKNSNFGQVMLSLRCSFVPAAYAILHSHFVYRFFAIFSNKFLTRWFVPYGLILTVIYSLFLMGMWFLVSIVRPVSSRGFVLFPACYVFKVADAERHDYIESSFQEAFDEDVRDFNIIVVLYREGSREAVNKSWIGMTIVSFISLDSVIIYFILGTLIVRRLNSLHSTTSKTTKQFQKQLMKALVAQATIPMIVSFLPCAVVWYQPVFMIDCGRWTLWVSSVAISFFPVFDPLALFYFVPTFRRRVREIFGWKKNQHPVLNRVTPVTADILTSQRSH